MTELGSTSVIMLDELPCLLELHHLDIKLDGWLAFSLSPQLPQACRRFLVTGPRSLLRPLPLVLLTLELTL
jgi:hypothetical protein